MSCDTKTFPQIIYALHAEYILAGSAILKSVVPFRPTEKASEIIKAYMTENKLKSKSKAVTEIIERFKAPLPEGVTGNLVSCPMRPYAICDDFSLCEGIVINAVVDSSVCKTCLRYPCETWKNIESEKRIATYARLAK